MPTPLSLRVPAEACPKRGPECSALVYGAEVAAGGRVLEVGCGPGVGLGLLAASARMAVGADYDSVLLRRARATYGTRLPLIRLDVQNLPFADGSFDTVLFYEGSYYIPNMETAFDELARVLAPRGCVVFVNANPERPDFIPSPLSVHYHTAAEFRTALEKRGFAVEVEGAFPLRDGSGRSGMLILVRRVARALGVVPGTLAGRALLKRLLVGELVAVPAELLPEEGGIAARQRLEDHGPATSHKVLYVTARRPRD